MDENEMTLKIENLVLSDEKSYECKLQYEEAVSAVIKLTVNRKSSFNALYSE